MQIITTKNVINLFFVIDLLFTCGKGCHQLHKPSDAHGIPTSGRRRRAVASAINTKNSNNCYSPTKGAEDDANRLVSMFFTDCMLEKSGKIFNSWRSVIDFILRDTLWYLASDRQYCLDQDTVKCWQRRLNTLIRQDSKLLGYGKECINEFKQQFKKKSMCSTMYKRRIQRAVASRNQFPFARNAFSLEDRNAETTKNIDFDLDDVANVLQSSRTGPTEPSKICPSTMIEKFDRCVKSSVSSMMTSNWTSKYHSLKKYDQKSITEFVTNYYANCRITRMTNEIFVESCSESGSLLKHKRSISEGQRSACVISLKYTKIVRSTSPLFSSLESCTKKYMPSPPPSALSQQLKPTVTTKPLPTSSNYVIGECNTGDHWTQWYNEDSPKNAGDWEILGRLRKRFYGQICASPKGIEARRASDNKIAQHTGEKIDISPYFGLLCRNEAQIDRVCDDYKIRFCCSYPKIYCENRLQWTPWYDIDNPSEDGDFERRIQLLTRPEMCKRPIAVDGRLKESKQHYWLGYNIISVSPFVGLVCENNKQVNNTQCRDYEVRFCCPIYY